MYKVNKETCEYVAVRYLYATCTTSKPVGSSCTKMHAHVDNMSRGCTPVDVFFD